MLADDGGGGGGEGGRWWCRATNANADDTTASPIVVVVVVESSTRGCSIFVSKSSRSCLDVHNKDRRPREEVDDEEEDNDGTKIEVGDRKEVE